MSEKSIKPSFYNYIIPFHDDYILFNTFTNFLTIIDEDVKKALQELEKGHSVVLDDEILHLFKEKGVIIDEKIDEKKIIKCLEAERKYDSRFSTYTILTTYQCNLGCPYCYEGKGELLKSRMSMDMTDKVCNFIKKEYEKNRSESIELVLYGGEPFLNTECCFRLLEQLKFLSDEAELRVRAVTNGTLISEEIIENLADASRNAVVQITLHGPREIHDRIRIFKDGRGTFDILLESLRMLSESPVRPSVCINIDKESISEVDRLLDQLKEVGLQDVPIGFSPILPVTEVCRNYPSCVSEIEMQEYPQLLQVVKKKGFTYSGRHVGKMPLFCDALRDSSFTIDPVGDVYKCWNTVGQHQHRVGVITEDGALQKEYPYYDLMSRDPLHIEECANCKLLPLCGGGCVSRAYSRGGTYHRRGCYGERMRLASCLRNYVEQRIS